MRLRTLLAASAIALSSQASFAATDTSCNPFSRGSSCNGEIALGKSIGQHSFGKRSSASRVERLEAFQATARDMRSEGLRGVLNSLAARGIDLDEVTDFDEREELSVEELSVEEILAGEVSDGETDGEVEVAAVPIPASAVLLLAGLGGLVAMRRKKS